MKAMEMWVSYYITTQCHNLEDHNLYLHCCENPKPHKISIWTQNYINTVKVEYT